MLWFGLLRKSCKSQKEVEDTFLPCFAFETELTRWKPSMLAYADVSEFVFQFCFSTLPLILLCVFSFYFTFSANSMPSLYFLAYTYINTLIIRQLILIFVVFQFFACCDCIKLPPSCRRVRRFWIKPIYLFTHSAWWLGSSELSAPCIWCSSQLSFFPDCSNFRSAGQHLNRFADLCECLEENCILLWSIKRNQYRINASSWTA